MLADAGHHARATRPPDVVITAGVDRALAQADPGRHRVRVHVAAGVVVLSGVVESQRARLAAQQAAHRVEGVLDVVDDIDVSPQGRRQTDTAIARQVRAVLEADPGVPHRAVHTTTTRGWVTLEGVVASWSEQDAAERAVLRQPGVRGVTNLVTVPEPAARTKQTAVAVLGGF